MCSLKFPIHRRKKVLKKLHRLFIWTDIIELNFENIQMSRFFFNSTHLSITELSLKLHSQIY